MHIYHVSIIYVCVYTQAHVHKPSSALSIFIAKFLLKDLLQLIVPRLSASRTLAAFHCEGGLQNPPFCIELL